MLCFLRFPAVNPVAARPGDRLPDDVVASDHSSFPIGRSSRTAVLTVSGCFRTAEYSDDGDWVYACILMGENSAAFLALVATLLSAPSETHSIIGLLACSVDWFEASPFGFVCVLRPSRRGAGFSRTDRGNSQSSIDGELL